MKLAGICYGKRVAVFMEINTVFVLMAIALAKLGAIMVPINIRLHPKEIKYILRDANVSGLITSSSFRLQLKIFQLFFLLYVTPGK